MSEPYPQEQWRLAGEVVETGVRAPGAPVDPEADAEGGGLGTGEIDIAPDGTAPEPGSQPDSAEQ
jgi:hypothetical protein